MRNQYYFSRKKAKLRDKFVNDMLIALLGVRALTE
jgi:hypothetical protein